jgi:hypothetical protein
VTLISLLICASSLCAQQGPLAPGSPLLRADRIRMSTDSFRIESYRADTLWRSATLIRQVSRTRDTIVFAQTYRTNEGTTVDTSWVDARSLAPRRYFAEVYGEVQQFRFEGMEANGTVVPKDSASRPVAVKSQVPFFNAVAVDLIYSALPLAPGFTVDVPMYNPPRALMTIKLHVVGEDKLLKRDGGTVDAWLLDYQLGPITQKLWLDRKTGGFLRISASQAGNAFHKYREDLEQPEHAKKN